jgi:hypothetical protein
MAQGVSIRAPVQSATLQSAAFAGAIFVSIRTPVKGATVIGIVIHSEPIERRAEQFRLAKRRQIVAEKSAGDEIGAVIARKGKAEQPDHWIFPIRPPTAAGRRLLIYVLGDLWAAQQKDWVAFALSTSEFFNTIDP